MLKNSIIKSLNPAIGAAVSLSSLAFLLSTDYHTDTNLKHCLWGSFLFSTAVGLIPLVNKAGMAIVYDAILATGFTVGGLGLVALNAPSQYFLNWGGFLGIALAGMIGLSIMQIFKPNPLMHTYSLYMGVILFGCFILFDTQKLIDNAKKLEKWDPINESLDLYLDAIILFEYFVEIFMEMQEKEKGKEKKDEK